MAESAFTVTYDGPALSAGRIPVRDLAPALVALGELFIDASSLVDPDREPASLSLGATEAGSFSVQLILSIPDGPARITDLLTSDVMTSLANVQAVVIGGGGAVGLFQLIRLVRNRKIAKREPAATRGYVRVVLDDETVIEARGEAVELYIDRGARRNAQTVIKPLGQPGVETVELHSPITEPVRIAASEIDAFAIPDLDEAIVSETETEMLVEVAAPAFPANNKWRLSNGTSGTFWATIGDSAFLDRVNAGGEAFRKGDTLDCLFKITQVRSPAGLHTEHHVIEVRQHVARGQQLRLDDVT